MLLTSSTKLGKRTKFPKLLLLLNIPKTFREITTGMQLSYYCKSAHPILSDKAQWMRREEKEEQKLSFSVFFSPISPKATPIQTEREKGKKISKNLLLQKKDGWTFAPPKNRIITTRKNNGNVGYSGKKVGILHR